jgi:hypothetical protein
LSITMVIAVLLIFTIVLTQFGSRLAAKNSVIWWLFAGFLIFAAIFPLSLRPLADFMGIQVVSNMVIGIALVFLLIQLMEQAAINTSHTRQIRRLVCNLAARDFMKMQPQISGDKVKVLVTLPCYNEADVLARIIKEMQDLVSTDLSDMAIKFCFVNDGSKDGTPEILENLCPKEFTSHQVNVGVAGVLLTGFTISKSAGFDYVVQCDSDGQHPIEEIPHLIRHGMSEHYDLLIGSRFVDRKESSTESTTSLRLVGIVMLRAVLKLFGSNLRVYDPTSGFRLYSRGAVLRLLEHMPDEYPEPESIALLSLGSMKIGENQVKMKARDFGQSSIHGFGSAQYLVKVMTALLALRLRTIRNIW